MTLAWMHVLLFVVAYIVFLFLCIMLGAWIGGMTRRESLGFALYILTGGRKT